MITVVIPTMNRVKLLEQALESLRKQTLNPDQFEVLIVDNGSKDSTEQLVGQFGTKLGHLRYLYEPTPGLHSGRHRGLREAQGDVLVFVDDDVEALPTWLEAVDRCFAHPGVALVGGNNFPLFEREPPKWLSNLWERFDDRYGRSLPPLSILEWKAPPSLFTPYHVWGCNFCVRKSVLEDAGGFHPDGMPPDLIKFRGDGEVHVSRFVADSGLKTVFDPDASVFHKVPTSRMTEEYFYKRGFSQGISDSYTALRGAETLRAFTSRRRLIGRIATGWRRIRRALRLSEEAKKVLTTMHNGYLDGYSFHQRAYQEDASLRNWVHQSSYLVESDDD